MPRRYQGQTKGNSGSTSGFTHLFIDEIITERNNGYFVWIKEYNSYERMFIPFGACPNLRYYEINDRFFTLPVPNLLLEKQGLEHLIDNYSDNSNHSNQRFYEESEQETRYQYYYEKEPEEQKNNEEETYQHQKDRNKGDIEQTEIKTINQAYKVLFVRKSAPIEVIKASFKALASLYHPDKGGNNEKMKKLNIAYDLICKEKGIE